MTTTSNGRPSLATLRRVTIGSAAWLAPHLPSVPRLHSPVRPEARERRGGRGWAYWRPGAMESAPSPPTQSQSSHSQHPPVHSGHRIPACLTCRVERPALGVVLHGPPRLLQLVAPPLLDELSARLHRIGPPLRLSVAAVCDDVRIHKVHWTERAGAQCRISKAEQVERGRRTRLAGGPGITRRRHRDARSHGGAKDRHTRRGQRGPARCAPLPGGGGRRPTCSLAPECSTVPARRARGSAPDRPGALPWP